MLDAVPDGRGDGGFEVVFFLEDEAEELLAAAGGIAQGLVLGLKGLPASWDAFEGVASYELGIDVIVFGTEVEGAPVVFNEGGIDDADVMARFVEEGGKGAAITTGFLETKMEALAGSNAIEPKEEFGVTGGIGGEYTSFGASLGIS